MNRIFGYGIAALSPFIGLFLSVRFNAFLFQVIEWSYPSWGHLLAAALISLPGLVFRDRLAAFLTDHAYGLSLPALLVYGLSLPLSYALRSPLLYTAIRGTEIGSPFVRAACLIGCAALLGVFILLTAHALGLAFSATLRGVTGPGRRDVLFLLGLLAALNLIAWLYMQLSRTVYFWDTAGYWTTTHELAELLRTEGPAALLRAAYDSVLASDYNYIIALPGTLLCLLFGKSRYVFIAGIVNVYLFPLYAALYLYVRRRWRRPVCITSALVLFFPAILYIGLIGFIDVAGVLPCLLAALLYFRGDGRRMGDYVVSGCLLALAVLLRRWYAFFAATFLLSVLVDALFFRRSPLPLLGTMLPLGFILLFFFQPFVSDRLLADYGEMYAGYQLGLRSNFMLFFRYYGVVLTAGIFLLALVLILQRESRGPALFFTLQTIACFFLFSRVQTHGQQHLLLYAPAFLWFGVQGFGILFSLEPKPRAVFAAGAILALLPTVNCLIPREQPASVTEIRYPAALPNFSLLPEVREDIDALLDLTAYMDELMAHSDGRMAVLASSMTINREILDAVELSLSLRGADEIDRSYMLGLPAIDSRDSLPLELDGWDYVLVADPVQTHQGEENQRVVTVPAESFLNGTDIALAYTRLEETFTLGDGDIQVSLFVRDRDISQEEYAAYVARLQAALPDKF